MFDNLLLVAGQVFTLFLLMGVGFFFAKRGQITTPGLSQMTHVLLYVVSPCVVIDALAKAERSPELMRSILWCFPALIVSYVIYALLAIPLYPRLPRDTRDALRMGTIYGNTGFMGIPLISGVLGQAAMPYCTVGLGVFNIATWTHGAVLMGGRENASAKKALLNPGVIGCVIGFFLFFTGLAMPGPIASAVGFLGSLNTPLAMLVIGAQMAGADLPATFQRLDLWLASGMKLILLPALTMVLLLPFRLPPLTYQTLVILSACPTAGITGIFAQRFDRDPASAAQLITLSTLLSILTLPVAAVAAAAVCPL